MNAKSESEEFWKLWDLADDRIVLSRSEVCVPDWEQVPYWHDPKNEKYLADEEYARLCSMPRARVDRLVPHWLAVLVAVSIVVACAAVTYSSIVAAIRKAEGRADE